MARQLLPREDLPAGIGRIAENQRLRSLPEGRPQLHRIEREIGRPQRHVQWPGPREDGIRAVVLVERREDDDRVSGVAGGHHRDHHRLGAAAGDDQMAVRVQRQPHEPRLLGGQRRPEIGRPPGDRVLMGARTGAVRERRRQGGRRVEVRKSLRQVDGAVLIGHPGHSADDGFGEDSGAFAGLRHVVPTFVNRTRSHASVQRSAARISLQRSALNDRQ